MKEAVNEMRKFLTLLIVVFSIGILFSCTNKPIRLEIENCDNIVIKVNEDYISDDMVVYAVYKDLTKVDVTKECSFYPIDNTTPGKKRVIVTYGKLESFFYVYVERV